MVAHRFFDVNDKMENHPQIVSYIIFGSELVFSASAWFAGNLTGYLIGAGVYQMREWHNLKKNF